MQCCKHVFWMFRTFKSNVPNVSCWCCKINLDVRCCMKWFEMFHYCFDDVATFVSVCSTTTFSCCDICMSMFHYVFSECYGCWVSMLQTRDVECCVERGGRRPLMFGCCTRHESQHGCNIVATWGRRQEYSLCWMLHTLLLATCHTQIRNIDPNIPRWMLRARRFATWGKLFATFQKLFATFATPATRSTADTLPHLNRAAQDPPDASARIRRPGASSSLENNDLQKTLWNHNGLYRRNTAINFLCKP
jgi:hypothetical protein